MRTNIFGIENYDKEYFYRYCHNWQGNISAVTDQYGKLEQTTDYYPYGMPMTTSTGATVNPYKFGAKELETESGLNHYDFGARWLLAQLSLFTTPDPKASDYPDVNTYLYCKANPINYTDPTGEKVVVTNKNDQLLFKEIFDADVQKYIDFDNDGLLNHLTLSRCLSNSWILILVSSNV